MNVNKSEHCSAEEVEMRKKHDDLILSLHAKTRKSDQMLMVSMADSLNEISFHNLQIDLFIRVNVYHQIIHERLSPINNSD